MHLDRREARDVARKRRAQLGAVEGRASSKLAAHEVMAFGSLVRAAIDEGVRLVCPAGLVDLGEDLLHAQRLYDLERAAMQRDPRSDLAVEAVGGLVYRDLQFAGVCAIFCKYPGQRESRYSSASDCNLERTQSRVHVGRKGIMLL